jgi:MFS family permease
MLLGASFILTVLFEIPTGIVGDKIARKYVLLSAICFKALCLIAWWALPSFWGYMLGIVALSLSYSLESGALQAYLYGTLGKTQQKSFGKFWARISALIMISWTAAYLLATLIGINYPLLIALSIIACTIAILLCVTLPKDRLIATNPTTKPKILRSAVKHIWNTKELLSLLAGAVIAVAIAEVMIEYLSLYYSDAGVVTRYVPVLMAVGNVAGAILFWTLHAWENFLNKYKLLLTILFSLLFALSFLGGVAVACLGALVFTRFIRVLQVQFDSNLQHLSNEEARVTISSIASFAAKIIAAIVVLLVGIFAVDNSILQPLRITLLAGMTLFVLVNLVLRRRERLTLQKQPSDDYESQTMI